MRARLFALALISASLLSPHGLAQSANNGFEVNTGGTRWVRDIVYDPTSPLPYDTSLDVYTAGDATGKPVMLFVHGGANRVGDKAYPPTIYHKLQWSLEHDYVFVSINHRLGSAGAFPINTQDVANAVGWVVRNIADYGGDPERVLLTGHSSGAMHLTRVGTDPQYLANAGVDLTQLAGFVLIDMPQPAADLTALPASVRPPFLLLHVGNGGQSEEVTLAFADGLRRTGTPVRVAELIGDDHFSANENLGKPGHPATVALERFVQPLFTAP